MKVNQEIRNDELKIAMISFKLQDVQASENEFLEKLRMAFFLVPIVDDKKRDEFTFMLLEDQDNNNYFQGYTDIDEYNKWIDSNNSKHLVLTFDEYANIIINSGEEVKGLVLNPFGENIILDKNILNTIFNMDKVFIDEIGDVPTNVKKKIKKIVKENDKINEAYLMNMKKSNIPGYLLIINTKVRNKKKLFSQIGEEIKKNFDEINIDIMPTSDNIAHDVIKGKEPFYKK